MEVCGKKCLIRCGKKAVLRTKRGCQPPMRARIKSWRLGAIKCQNWENGQLASLKHGPQNRNFGSSRFLWAQYTKMHRMREQTKSSEQRCRRCPAKFVQGSLTLNSLLQLFGVWSEVRGRRHYAHMPSVIGHRTSPTEPSSVLHSRLSVTPPPLPSPWCPPL